MLHIGIFLKNTEVTYKHEHFIVFVTKNKTRGGKWYGKSLLLFIIIPK